MYRGETGKGNKTENIFCKENARVREKLKDIKLGLMNSIDAGAHIPNYTSHQEGGEGEG